VTKRLTEFAMPLVLIAICIVLSIATWTEQSAEGPVAAKQLADELAAGLQTGERVVVVARGATDRDFAPAVESRLKEKNISDIVRIEGEPRDARRALKELDAQKQKVAVIAASPEAAAWLIWKDLNTDFPSLGNPAVRTSRTSYWPTFLKADNLINVANQISVIAILAVGMTFVILTGGIDLCVGSLIALSAVTTCLLIERWGGVDASRGAMAAASLLGIGVGGLTGLLNGVVITRFRVPPFIVTLATMQIAVGAAFLLTGGESAYHVPQGFTALGVGKVFGRIPNSVVLTLALYAVAYVLLTRTVMGRYLYAVGGNAQAAKLSGVRVSRVLIFAYVMSGLLAGLGGIVMASRFRSGSPKFGQAYELSVIAAVVVGGTSLSGGEGSVIGTLIGALIIAVIQNGMNLLDVNVYCQQIVLGSVILIAVLLDNLKHRGRG
jgi:ribose transport system permease protein